MRNKTFLPILSAGLLAASLLAAPSAAPAKTDPFHQRMMDWEIDTGHESRMMLYGEVASLGLPGPSEAIANALAEAAKHPFDGLAGAPEELDAFVESRRPAFDLFEKAGELDNFASYSGWTFEDPVPNLPELKYALQALCVRAQRKAMAGDLDGALDDLLLAWEAGRSMSQSANAPLVTVLIGDAFRSMALDSLIALLERFDLSEPQRERLKAALLAGPDAGETIFKAMERELTQPTGPMLEAIKAETAGQSFWERATSPSPEKAVAAYERGAGIMAQAVRDMAKAPRSDREAIWEEAFERAAEESPLMEVAMPSMRRTAEAQERADARENVVFAALVAWEANARAEQEVPGPEKIREAAGENADRLLDPFTGQTLEIDNKGGWAVFVRSVGPNGAVDPEGAPEEEADDIALGRQGRGADAETAE